MIGEISKTVKWTDGTVKYSRDLDEKPRQSDYRSHCHNAYELFCFIKGDAKYVVENKRYKLSPGNIVSVEPGKYHFLHLDGPASYERTVIEYKAEFLPHELKRTLCGTEFIAGGNETSMLIRRIDETSRRYPEELDRLLPAYIYELILLISRQKNQLSGDCVSPAVDRILSFINEHIYEPLSVDILSENLYLSPSHINHSFKKEMNASVMQYIRHKKVAAAQKLIEGGMKAVDVSETLGFENYSTFFRTFKALTGTPPSETSAAQRRVQIRQQDLNPF